MLTKAPGVDGRQVERLAEQLDGEPAEPAHQHVDHLAFAVPDGESLSIWADHLTEIGIEHPGIVLENGRPSLQLRDPDGVAIESVAP